MLRFWLLPYVQNRICYLRNCDVTIWWWRKLRDLIDTQKYLKFFRFFSFLRVSVSVLPPSRPSSHSQIEPLSQHPLRRPRFGFGSMDASRSICKDHIPLQWEIAWANYKNNNKPTERFLLLICVRGCVDPRTTMRLDGLVQLKYAMTSSGIQQTTFRLLACCLNQLRYRPFLPSLVVDWAKFVVS
jgi:hypothetical protein